MKISTGLVAVVLSILLLASSCATVNQPLENHTDRIFLARAYEC